MGGNRGSTWRADLADGGVEQQGSRGGRNGATKLHGAGGFHSDTEPNRSSVDATWDCPQYQVP